MKWISLITLIPIAFANYDFTQMCKDSGNQIVKDRLWSSNLDKLYENSDKIDFMELYKKYQWEIDSYDTFIHFNTPKKKFGSVVFYRMLSFISSYKDDPRQTLDNLGKQFEEDLKKKPLAMTSKEFWGKDLSEFSVPETKGSGVLAKIMCLTAKGRLLCSKRLKDAIESNKPIIHWSGNYITAPENFEKVFIDPTYYKPVLKTAQLVVERVKDFEEGYFSKVNLFDDLKSQFVLHGFSQEEATERAFNVLGAYGVRGASISYAWFIRKKNKPVYDAFTFLSAAISYLDKLGFKQGIMYSLPRQIHTDCLYGKPYHFWMSAWIAREQSKISTSKASIETAHLSGMIYELNATFNERSVNRVFKDDAFSPRVNQARFDNIHRGAGAYFGAYYGKKDLSVDTNTLLNKSFKSSRNVDYQATKPLDLMKFGEFLKYFYNWNTVLAPHAHLHKLKWL